MPSSLGTTSSPSNGSATRTLCIAGGFLLVWPLADYAANQFAHAPGFSPWYLGAALDLALFYALGARWWPLVVAADLLRLLIDPSGQNSFGVRVCHGFVTGLTYAGAYALLTGPLRVRFGTRTARDAILFVAIAALAAPAVAAFALMPVLVWAGQIRWSEVPIEALTFIVGDGIGIVAAFPAIVVALEWLAGDRQKFDPHVDPMEFAAALSCTVVSVLVAYALVPTDYGAPLLAIPFLPLAWLSIRAGIVGASIGVLAADITATSLQIAAHTPAGSLIDYQAFIGISGVMSLVLGAIACERNRLERRLRKRAETDALTGLANHSNLVEWMLARGERSLTLVVADIDDMRLLNEGVGRDEADALLAMLGSRLAELAAERSLLARVSADEFAYISEDHDIDAMVAALHGCVEEPFDLGATRIYLSLSLGIAVGPGREPDILLRAADAAVDRAKATHRREVVYTADTDTTRGQTLLAEIHRAADNAEFLPFFQPIYRRAQGRWKFVGVEALMRWDHPQRGILKPAAFLHLLERLAVGERVGWAILEASVAQTRIWRQRDPAFTMWVNVFGRQLHDPRFTERLLGILQAQGVPPSALVVEINETVVATDSAEIGAIAAELRAAGMRVAIDDFGTGGSSLGRLRDIPADVLKIDRSFVARSEIDPRARAVVGAIVTLAGEVDLEVVAEGVENALQLGVLESVGCGMVQGYALAHPMPAERVGEYVARAG